VDSDFVSSTDLEKFTGTKASTWRYWASIGTGPASFKLGRRRVWRKSDVMAWIAQQEVAADPSSDHVLPQLSTQFSPRLASLLTRTAFSITLDGEDGERHADRS
jgi:prophage regulatory protein